MEKKYDESDQASFINIMKLAGIIDHTPKEKLQSYRFGFINLGVEAREVFQLNIANIPAGMTPEDVIKAFEEGDTLLLADTREDPEYEKRWKQNLEQIKKGRSTSMKPSID